MSLKILAISLFLFVGAAHAEKKICSFKKDLWKSMYYVTVSGNNDGPSLLFKDAALRAKENRKNGKCDEIDWMSMDKELQGYTKGDEWRIIAQDLQQSLKRCQSNASSCETTAPVPNQGDGKN